MYSICICMHASLCDVCVSYVECKCLCEFMYKSVCVCVCLCVCVCVCMYIGVCMNGYACVICVDM